MPGAVWTIGYTAEGPVQVVSTPTSVLRAQFSTSRGWMTALSHEVRGTPAPPPFFSVTYQRDAIGRITGITDAKLTPSPEGWTCTYDTLDQLTRAQNAANASETRTYTYDLAGNMLSNSAVGAYTYPTQGPNALRAHAPLTAERRSLGRVGRLPQ